MDTYVGMDDYDEGISDWRLAHWADWQDAAEHTPAPVVPFTLKADRMAQADGHAVAWGYDGEGEGPRGGVYGWDCDCGATGTDYGSEDDAALGASAHLAEIEILTEAVA